MKQAISVIGTAALLAALAPAAAQATPPQEPDQKARTTQIVLNVEHCKGCKIQGNQWNTSTPKVDPWYTKRKPVKNGTVKFRVPSHRTIGMTFTVDDPRPSDLNAVPLIASRYRGQPVGTKVTNAEARNGRVATPCWAGSKRDRIVRDVGVRHYTTGKGVRGVRVWFRRSTESTKPYSKTFHGTLATQDVYGCRGG